MNVSALRHAARNAWAISPLGDGIEPRRPTPSTVLYEEPHARVERIAASVAQAGDPVLLVTPLAVSVACWDLRTGQSLAAHLAGAATTSDGARPTYTIDYGPMTFGDRRMGFEDWVDRILPDAVARISAEHGGRPVHLVGWSHGGTMSLLLGAHRPDLPIASITGVGTPTDYSLNAAFAPLFWARDNLGLRSILLGSALAGGTTRVLTRLGYRSMAPVREITKPWALITNLHDREVLGRIEAVDQFIGSMPAYPARFFHQAVSRIVCGRELATGTVRLTDDIVIDMRRLRVPLLLIGSTDDILAEAGSVAAGVDAYPNAEVEFRGVAGLSHLGLIASPRASTITWPAIVGHLAAHDSTDAGQASDHDRVEPAQQSGVDQPRRYAHHPGRDRLGA